MSDSSQLVHVSDELTISEIISDIITEIEISQQSESTSELLPPDENLTLCESCGREWDGNAQCPCGIGYFIDTEGSENEIANTWDQVLSWINEYEYEPEEYELIEEDIPENNYHAEREITETVKKIGEKLYENKHIISDGDYLIMMNELQKITNAAKHL